MCVYARGGGEEREETRPKERGSEREGGRGMIEREETIEKRERERKKGREGDE